MALLQTEARALAAQVSAQRARENTVAIWECARGMDSGSIWRAAETAVERLRAAGIADARVEALPADGSAVNGWLLPVAWDVRAAVLDLVLPDGRTERLADYKIDPQSVAACCPPTPRGRWMTGRIQEPPPDGAAPGSPRGCFVLVAPEQCRADANAAAAASGAIAVITTSRTDYADARKYLNNVVPFTNDVPSVPCFVLSPHAEQRLRAALRTQADVTLRCRVAGRRYAGRMPMVTGSVGAGGPPLYLCAHIDEIGAQDNASGCGVAIEALRVLQAAVASPSASAPRRAIRFFFSAEVRGQQAWLAAQAQLPTFLAGLNLDQVGTPSRRDSEPMIVRTGFLGRPHFAGAVLEAAARIADGVAGRLYRERGPNFLSDAALSLHGACGHVSLEQKTGAAYHSSADTPAWLCDHTLRWTAAAGVAFLYTLSRMDGREVMPLARRIAKQVDAALSANPANVREARAAIAAMRTLQAVIPNPAMHAGERTPAAVYARGVNRRTGLWPEVALRQTLGAYIQPLAERAARLNRPAAKDPGPQRVAARAAAQVPLSLQPGFLSFEDRYTPEARRELKARLGLAPTWGSPTWAWHFAARCRGKRTTRELIDDLTAYGMPIEPAQAVALADYLVDQGLARFRPVLTKADIVRALRAAGVARGMTLVAHTSLSRFGYISGGPATVVDALLEAVGSRGTLLMPTHSNSVLGAPPYRREHSPARTGAIAETFRTRPGVTRSVHPTHSVAGLGPAAADLLAAHRADQAPLARAGFWGRLCAAGGHVLLMCPIRSATIFHVGETWLGLPQAPLVAHTQDAAGKRRVLVLPNGPWHVNHFEPTMARPLMEAGTMTTTPLGESEIYLAPAQSMADISVAVNRENPLVSLGQGGTCTCFYCEALRAGVRG
jgi:aminoglycoside 3-N-acetyltransferase